MTLYNMEALRTRSMCRAALVSLFAIGAVAIVGHADAARASVRGVWMAGPGCGAKHEWFQHPREFPYFCDGAAVVESAHWKNWGTPKATARAIMNEAELNNHNSVATAPRTRRAVTIKASQIKVCGGRHTYTRIVIHFHKAVNGVKKLEEAELLPKCSTPGQAQNRHLTSFMSPDRKVWCTVDSFAAACGTEPEPPTHSAWLEPNGKVSLCSVLRTEYPEGSKVPLTCFQNWPLPSDHVPVLKIGETTQDSGFRCTSSADGITCTDAAGAGKGHGFRINKEEAVEVEA
jgi:hypothetical protein